MANSDAAPATVNLTILFIRHWSISGKAEQRRLKVSQETGPMRGAYGFQTGLSLGGRRIVGMAFA